MPKSIAAEQMIPSGLLRLIDKPHNVMCGADKPKYHHRNAKPATMNPPMTLPPSLTRRAPNNATVAKTNSSEVSDRKRANKKVKPV
jgi:hypothetical protein